jgi:RHH-type proline utilization regulon transcriptional repressor/proline dehydrogenase/delta 1-pyrroline-5-carboxylate dehydrogenase
MGEPLYEQVVGKAEGGSAAPAASTRRWAAHDTLLAYLVRRLLENGANTSFVNRIADEACRWRAGEDPVATVEALAARGRRAGPAAPAIPLPRALYGAARANSRGLDLATRPAARLPPRWPPTPPALAAAPLLAADAPPRPAGHPPKPVRNPAAPATSSARCARPAPPTCRPRRPPPNRGAPAWAATPAAEARAILDAPPTAGSGHLPLLPLLMREAGKTCPTRGRSARGGGLPALLRARRGATSTTPATARWARWSASAPGTSRWPSSPARSPRRWPPATWCWPSRPSRRRWSPPRRRLLHAAGVPRGALQLLPGRGETVGAALVADARVQGVLFTGSTEVARLLQRQLWPAAWAPTASRCR